eukprot:CAMPEP_0201585558 /NCGR_PEP_ID=MMETSP0190_2-20130828/123369_1 /ASSEMBLY_ACC=CAM_ASM_000263 /TAXON_ID=37353 /ORGANISM="Rosalina sp." /LENGTH=246 /DNA_ID=CAMNT_0048031735 /DNA_START=1 /DNA_END=738 /DNA_ORIENTATION=+
MGMGMGMGMSRGMMRPRSQAPQMGARVTGGLGSLPPPPRIRPLSNSKVPLPPRIQLIDLPAGHPMRRSSGSGSGRRYSARADVRRRLNSGQNNGYMNLHRGSLGTGMGIGMTGHHHKYGMSTNFLQSAMQNGMSKKDLVKNALVADIALNAEEKEAKKQQEKNKNKDSRDGDGFGGFNGFDGFGSGYLHTKEEKEAMKRRKRGGRGRGSGRMNPAGITFGLDDRERRRLIYDEDDIDVYDYEDIEN